MKTINPVIAMKIYNDERLTSKIVMELAFCSERTANRRIAELKKVLHIQHNEILFVDDFVKYYRINPNRIIYRSIAFHNEIDLCLPCLDFLA